MHTNTPSYLYIYPKSLTCLPKLFDGGQIDEITGTSPVAFKSQIYPRSFHLNHQRLYKVIYLRTLESLKISDSSHSQPSNAADSLSST